MKLKNVLIRYGLALAVILPSFAFAQLPPGNAITFGDINGIGYTLLEFAYGLALTLAVIYIVWSGIMMMSARENPTQFTNAQKQLRNAVLGFAVVFGAGVIINTVAAVVDRSFFCQASIPVVNICIY